MISTPQPSEICTKETYTSCGVLAKTLLFLESSRVIAANISTFSTHPKCHQPGISWRQTQCDLHRGIGIKIIQTFCNSAATTGCSLPATVLSKEHPSLLWVNLCKALRTVSRGDRVHWVYENNLNCQPAATTVLLCGRYVIPTFDLGAYLSADARATLGSG